MPHKYAAAHLEIPASYSHRKTAKSTPVLFEKKKELKKKAGKDFGSGSAIRALNRESSTAQRTEIGSVPQTEKGGEGRAGGWTG